MLHIAERFEAPGLITSQMEGATKKWKVDKRISGEPGGNIRLITHDETRAAR